MKMTVAGVQRVSGIAKVSGNAFDMCNLICLVPVETFSNAKTRVEGVGFKSMEIPMDPLAIPQFAGLKFPLEMELVTEARPRSGKLETVVVGRVPAPK